MDLTRLPSASTANGIACSLEVAVTSEAAENAVGASIVMRNWALSMSSPPHGLSSDAVIGNS